MGEASELYLKYRPKRLDDVVGQDVAVKTVRAMKGRVPHAILLTGPSGCGKTTLGRIIAKNLRCTGTDFVEVNAAKERGIDMVRDMSQRIGLAPMGSRCRVWLLDECHALSADAQSALLKLLEDTPSHAYLFLATTDPQKLKTTIKTRCTEIKCKAITKDTLRELVVSVAKAEDIEIDEDVVNEIVKSADGSARKALVILNQVIVIETPEEQLEAVKQMDSKAEAIELCRLLASPETTSWKKVAAVLKDIGDADAEGIRYMVLGYFRTMLLNSAKKQHAVSIIEAFQDNFYDSKHAGLALACYEIIEGE